MLNSHAVALYFIALLLIVSNCTVTLVRLWTIRIRSQLFEKVCGVTVIIMGSENAPYAPPAPPHPVLPCDTTSSSTHP